MDTSTEETSENVTRICPGCAIEQLTRGQPESGSCTAGPVVCNVRSALKYCKEACGLDNGVTIYMMASMVYGVLAVVSAAVAGLIKVVKPLVMFNILVLIYILDSVNRVWHEKRLHMAILTASTAAAATLLLACVVYLFISMFAVPVTTFLYQLLQAGFSF